MKISAIKTSNNSKTWSQQSLRHKTALLNGISYPLSRPVHDSVSFSSKNAESVSFGCRMPNVPDLLKAADFEALNAEIPFGIKALKLIAKSSFKDVMPFFKEMGIDSSQVRNGYQRASSVFENLHKYSDGWTPEVKKLSDKLGEANRVTAFRLFIMHWCEMTKAAIQNVEKSASVKELLGFDAKFSAQPVLLDNKFILKKGNFTDPALFWEELYLRAPHEGDADILLARVNNLDDNNKFAIFDPACGQLLAGHELRGAAFVRDKRWNAKAWEEGCKRYGAVNPISETGLLYDYRAQNFRFVSGAYPPDSRCPITTQRYGLDPKNGVPLPDDVYIIGLNQHPLDATSALYPIGVKEPEVYL